ncbi:MAG: SusC/RagA family TonB-linked outer membrane protein, partial [Chitinophagaceae bacterium]|nr:SusC/RagA family TonB-linked outer membrane protein [Chitinophagaceae bacterium]
GLNFVKNNNLQGNNPGFSLSNGAGKGLYPYARLVDDNGNPINLIENNNTGFVQKAQAAGLQDWTYNPIQDINNTRNTNNITDIVANAGLRYNIIDGLNFEVKYQYESQQTLGNKNYGPQSFYARNLENQFAQVASNNSVSYPIPLGAIVDLNNSELSTHQGRAQLNFQKSFNKKNEITAIAGWEIKNIKVNSNANRYYGYDSNISTVNNFINYNPQFTQYDNIYNALNIPNFDAISGTLNRYLSYYANASYSYDGRYIISGSARQDGSNLFGVKTNQKSVPLWSTGIAWVINRESFYNSSWLPELKIRATYGLQGNVYTQASAYATATYKTSRGTGLPDAVLQNPPNDQLRWEKNGTFNIGVDFAFKNDIISGSIDYYRKNSNDLMAYAPVDPTIGITNTGGASRFFGNVAGMHSNGIDFTLNANILKGNFKWSSTYTLSYANPKVTTYDMPVSPIGSSYVTSGLINPVVGKSIYGLYSYQWAGLDPLNGNPQGYLHGKLSTDYASILAQTPLDSMVYKGPAIPPLFGSWRNTFSFKNVSLSINISYQFGYYFRAPSINYWQLFTTWTGSSDYANRWQKTGDEKTTYDTSMIYPANSSRDQFYTYSDALMQKGDHIRLEDITLSYDFAKAAWKRSPFKEIKVYGYASNLGLLWKANKLGLDPDYLNFPTAGKSFAIGVNLIF